VLIGGPEDDRSLFGVPGADTNPVGFRIADRRPHVVRISVHVGVIIADRAIAPARPHDISGRMVFSFFFYDRLFINS
jgi:hypothetical protein